MSIMAYDDIRIISHRSWKQLGFLVYSGTGEHSAPVRFSGRPHAELCSDRTA